MTFDMRKGGLPHDSLKRKEQNAQEGQLSEACSQRLKLFGKGKGFKSNPHRIPLLTLVVRLQFTFIV